MTYQQNCMKTHIAHAKTYNIQITPGTSKPAHTSCKYAGRYRPLRALLPCPSWRAILAAVAGVRLAAVFLSHASATANWPATKRGCCSLVEIFPQVAKGISSRARVLLFNRRDNSGGMKGFEVPSENSGETWFCSPVCSPVSFCSPALDSNTA